MNAQPNRKVQHDPVVYATLNGIRDAQELKRMGCKIRPLAVWKHFPHPEECGYADHELTCEECKAYRSGFGNEILPGSMPV